MSPSFRPLSSACRLWWALLGAAGVAFGAVGCAAPAADPAVAAASGECKLSYRVGSNIASKTCMAPQTEEERQQVISEMQNQVHMLSEPVKVPGP